MDIGRRAFLCGRRSPEIATQPVIGPACLSVRGIVCRSCEDRCETGAIRFIPRAGHPALPEIDTARCTDCGECVAACPTRAIAPRPTEAAAALRASPVSSTPIRHPA